MSADITQGVPVVLVADDDMAGRLLVRESLEQAGLRVVEAGNGLEAVARFIEFQPQLVLLDVVMPEMDGYTACAALRKLPGGQAVPILMLTGLDDIESINRAYEVGATDFATKPVNWLVLRHRVRYMLRAGQVLDELHRSEARLTAAQRTARLGSWEWDLVSGRGHWSSEVYRLLGYEAGKFWPDYGKFMDRVHPDDRGAIDAAVEAARAAGTPYAVDHRITLPDGTIRHLHVQGLVDCDTNGRPVLMLGTIQDVSERKQAEERIRTLAYYDSLTHLPNRQLYNEQLNFALSSARRHTSKVATVLFDLDHFKRINETLGHSVGDRLLVAVAERLRQCLRDYDAVSRAEVVSSKSGTTLARLGGDEFILAMADIDRAEDAAKAAHRLIQAMQTPFRLDEHEIVMTASIGISLYPDDGEDTETLLKNADSALYHAKDAGRNNYQFYNQSMNAKALARLSLEGSLRRALEKQEFLLHYQPQVDARSGAIVGAEALIRWGHSDLGLVSPLDFIPLAEESGLIVPIGEWVLQTACAELKAWQDAGNGTLRMAVNLSGRQFRQHDLVETVQRAIGAAGIDPQSLELEITESVLMQDASETARLLDNLKALGVKLSVDDFGTGYSSLSYLKRFPIDSLKIDRSFIRDIASDPDDAAITTAILAMAGGLGLEVVAEGVETMEQLGFLRGRKCQMIQGYLFSKPLPSEQIRALLCEQIAGKTLWRMTEQS
jgi:diguanylate cyclase (GGDEF)-like protein/PAS domain S-box-containing protein